MDMQHTKTWDTVKVVLRGKFILINIYIKKKTETPTNKEVNFQSQGIRKRKNKQRLKLVERRK